MYTYFEVEAATKNVSVTYIQNVNTTPMIVPLGIDLLGLFSSPVKWIKGAKFLRVIPTHMVAQ